MYLYRNVVIDFNNTYHIVFDTEDISSKWRLTCISYSDIRTLSKTRYFPSSILSPLPFLFYLGVSFSYFQSFFFFFINKSIKQEYRKERLAIKLAPEAPLPDAVVVENLVKLLDVEVFIGDFLETERGGMER